MGRASPGKRKNEAVTDQVKVKRSRNDCTTEREAVFSDGEDDIEAPEFSDLDNSGDETASGKDDNKTKSKIKTTVASNLNQKHNIKPKKEIDEFNVFEKSGRTSKDSLHIVPVEEILGVKLSEPKKKQKTTKSRHDKEESRSSDKSKVINKNSAPEKNKTVNGTGGDSKNIGHKNIFEEFLGSEKLKAVTEKVKECTDSQDSSKIHETSTDHCKTDSSKHKHRSSSHHSTHGGRKHSSGDKDRKRNHSSSSHDSAKHKSEKDKHKSSSHKHSRHSKESAEGLDGKERRHSSSSHKSSRHSSHHKHHRHKEKHSSKSNGHSHGEQKSSGVKENSASGKGLKRQVSHVELFGEDSDSESCSKVEVYLVLLFPLLSP